MNNYLALCRSKLTVLFVALVAANSAMGATSDPLLTSWMTNNSSQYARVYKTTSAQSSGTTITTWTNQPSPSYSDIQTISYSANWVYVQYAGLSSYVMGPWLNPQGGVYVNWPTNQHGLRRFPRTPSVPSSKGTTSAGYSGLFVNGVAIFNSLDGFAWNGSSDVSSPHTTSTYYWHRNAPVEESFNFDPALGHQPPNGIYHTHQNPIGLRYQLGDHVSYNSTAKTYSESTNAVTAHSPIVGWAHDGYPIYGPYGYSNALNSASGVRRMVAGYAKRDGSNGTDILSTNLFIMPAWYSRYRQRHFSETYTNTAPTARPTINGTYPLGMYAEDWAYLGDCGKTQGTDFDLDEYNGRYCVTPEYPSGTYAYFVDIDSSGNSTYPYVLAYEFYGSGSGGSVNNITESVTTNFIGGQNFSLKLNSPTVDQNSSTVSLVWSSVEGGTYLVETSTNQSTWTTQLASVPAQRGTSTTTNFVGNNGTNYARVSRTALATYDAVYSGGSSTQTATQQYVLRTPLSTPSITLSPTNVCPSTDNNQASGPSGMAGYSWTVTNAYITDGSENSQTMTYSVPATSGYVGLTLIVTNSFGDTATNSSQVSINPLAGASINPPPPVCPNSTGNVASVSTGTNAATYAWTISNGTITSATNASTITFTAGSSGSVGLGVLVTSDAGCGSGDYTEVPINSVDATITTSATVLANSTTNIASAAAGASSYSWTISNGTITTATNVQSITYTAGATGNVTLHLTVASADGCSNNSTTNVAIISGDVVSVSFGADKSGVMSAIESAGVVAVANWITVSNANASTNGLVDNIGAKTTMSASWTANNIWSTSITNTPGNYRMMKAYLDNTSTGAATVTVSGIPASYSTTGYDVIVYCDGDNGSDARVGKYTISTSSITNIFYNLDAPGTNFSGTFTQSSGVSDQGTNTPAGNYVRFTGLTNSSFKVVATPGSNTGLASNARAPINAIQIVASSHVVVAITANPTNQSVCVAQNASFTAAATGATSVQWQVKTNGGSSFVNIANATNSTLTFTAASSDNGSQYQAVFSNNSSSATTTAATLTVNAPPSTPTISFSPQSPCPYTIGNTATGPAGMSGYTWTVVTNATITSGANSQTVTYSVGEGGQQAMLQLTVTNASGCTAQNLGLAYINPLPDPTITAATSVVANSTTNSASAPFNPLASYIWTITNGTITAGANSSTITYTAGASGNVQLILVETSNSGCATNSSVLIPIQIATPTNFVIGDVQTNWITTSANQYVRLYTNNAAKNAGVSVTTWTYTSIDGTNVDNKQALPVYSGVQAIYSSSNFVYIRSSGMPSSTLGPLLAYAPANLILPTNQHSLFRFPRNATVPTTKTLTPGGPIGFMLDGAIMFDIRDALAWNGSAEVMNTGTNGYWCRDAYVNEGYGFDPVGGHSAPSGGYHYHANPMALRYRLGDHMTYNVATKTYSEATNTPTQHSPIIGWVQDGFPVYGPYGYASAFDANSGIRRMVSGFVLRNGQNGTANLTLVGRTNIPAWAQRIYGVSLATGPSVSSSYPLGRYLEDHDHLGDLKNPNTGTSYVKGVDFDLDEYNGRYCVTPEFPNGVYAYFVTIDTNGSPAFPYYIGRAFYGSASGGNVQNIAETVVTNFVGVPNIPADLSSPLIAGSSVTLTWSATEGGNYRVESSTNLTTWVTNTAVAPAMLTLGSYTGSVSNAPTFFRVALTSLASYDSVISTNTGGGGGGTTITMSPSSGTHGQTYNVTATISASATPAPPPQSGAPIQSFTVGSISVTGATYTYSNGTGTVSGSLVIPAGATTGPQTVTITFSPPPGQQTGPTYTQQNGFTIN